MTTDESTPGERALARLVRVMREQQQKCDVAAATLGVPSPELVRFRKDAERRVDEAVGKILDARPSLFGG